MNSYNNFAYIYDRLMYKDINYNHLADYIENIFDYYDKSPDIVCDLACGTGNVTIPLSMRGYDMIGVDKSCSMLNCAREKAANKSCDILFLNQDLSKLDLYGSAGAFLCMTDGINYMTVPANVKRLFTRIKSCFLDTGGIFIFDISSRYKLKNVLGNNTFLHDDGKIFYTWENRYFEKSNLCRMDLSFFVKSKCGWKRFDELHVQRAHSEKEIIYVLKQAGFTHVDIFSPYTFNKPSKEEDRIVFAAM